MPSTSPKTSRGAPVFQVRDPNDSIASPSPLMDDDSPRFAIGDNGQIIYGNQAFQDLLPAKMQGADTLIAEDIMSLTTKIALASATSGQHNLRIKGHRKAMQFRFDTLQMPGGKNYIVASAIAGQSADPEPEFDEETKSFLAGEIQNSTQNPQRHKLGSLEEASDLRRFLNMSNDMMIVARADGRILRVNNAFGDLMGYDDTDLDRLNILDLLDEEDRPQVRGLIQTLNTHDDDVKIIDFETKVTGKDGAPRWIEWRQRKRDDLLYCVGRDVTDIKRHEQNLLKRQSQLSEAEAIAAMGHWHWRVGQDDIEWSSQIFEIYGVAREEFAPTLDKLNAMIHRRDIGRVIQIFQRAMIEQNNYGMDFRIKRPDGEVRYIYCEGRCELDEDGDVAALYGIMQDMTERILHEQDLKKAKNEAERAYAARTQFLANMSHELRTPLNAIIGFSEMMQRQLLGPIGTEKYLEYIGGIRESGGHLLDLISDILDMSKIEAGKYDLAPEEVNVSKSICLAAHMMEGRAIDAGVKISTKRLKDDKLVIQADRRAILQIMLNLLSNAVKFSNDGGKVWVECTQKGENIQIKVCDNGIGIPANKLQNITMPFEQASSSYSRDHEGTGLGLAITKELIGLHGGTLKIESQIGEGTNVIVKLPLDARGFIEASE